MKYLLALGCALLLLVVIGCSSERITNGDASTTMDTDSPAFKPPVIDNPPPGDPHELGGGFRGNEGDPAGKPVGDPDELGGGFRGNEGDPDGMGDGLG